MNSCFIYSWAFSCHVLESIDIGNFCNMIDVYWAYLSFEYGRSSIPARVTSAPFQPRQPSIPPTTVNHRAEHCNDIYSAIGSLPDQIDNPSHEEPVAFIHRDHRSELHLSPSFQHILVPSIVIASSCNNDYNSEETILQHNATTEPSVSGTDCLILQVLYIPSIVLSCTCVIGHVPLAIALKLQCLIHNLQSRLR